MTVVRLPAAASPDVTIKGAVDEVYRPLLRLPLR